jgi:hypothetical protein
MSHSLIDSRVLCGGGAAGHKSMSMIMNTFDPMLVDGNNHVVYTILDFSSFPTRMGLCHHIDISTTLMTETRIMRHHRTLVSPSGRLSALPKGQGKRRDGKLSPIAIIISEPRDEALRFPPPSICHLPTL